MYSDELRDSVEQTPPSKSVYTIPEWCHEARLSQACFFKQQRLNNGPRVARIGRHTIVVESPGRYYERICGQAAGK